MKTFGKNEYTKRKGRFREQASTLTTQYYARDPVRQLKTKTRKSIPKANKKDHRI